VTNRKDTPKLPDFLYIEAGNLRDLLSAVAGRLAKRSGTTHDDLRIATADLMIRADQSVGTSVPVAPKLLARLIEFATTA